MHALIAPWKKWLAVGIEEDGAAFDWTARAAADAGTSRPLTAELIAKAPGVWAAETGLQALKILASEQGLPLEMNSFVKDGEALTPGKKICEWRGAADAVVGIERTFINLAAYVSGIATQTRALVDQVQASPLRQKPRIVGTRKTLPGYRALAIQATLIGGAHPHRYNLSGGLLLKENHIAAAGSIERAVKRAREVIPHLLKVEIEVRNLDELAQAIRAGAEVILLDNFSPELIREAVKQKPASVSFEVSGGVNAKNLSTYLIEGIDVISVGSLTHSVTALDLSLLVR